MARWMLLLVAVTAVLAVPATASAAPAFTDWTGAGAGQATGALNGTSVLLSGPQVTAPPGSVVDGSSTYFAPARFTPSLAAGDAIEIIGANGSSFTLASGDPVENPVLHLGSLATELGFSAATYPAAVGPGHVHGQRRLRHRPAGAG